MEPIDKKNKINKVYQILEAVAYRIIPEDEGPSGADAGGLTYLERFVNRDDEVWIDVLEPGLHALEADAISQYQQSFSELSANEQDALLHALECGHVQNWPVSPESFFNTIVNLIIEGYYGNPEAGGNRGGKSWD